MTTYTRQWNSFHLQPNMLLDRIIPATRLCSTKITNRKAAIS